MFTDFIVLKNENKRYNNIMPKSEFFLCHLSLNEKEKVLTQIERNSKKKKMKITQIKNINSLIHKYNKQFFFCTSLIMVY